MRPLPTQGQAEKGGPDSRALTSTQYPRALHLRDKQRREG